MTTCLLLGLRNNEDGKVYYYRVNINKDGKSQNIERNHVYKININNVSELGADSEYNAWSQSKSLLNVTVVDWGLDPNGMVLTDGTNTMMLPVKLESLDPLGEVSENTVYTIGSETLYISQRSLPVGITANLIGGTLLQVKAEPLPTDPQTGKALERRGSIELAYGSLRGIISFVQTPDNTIYLSLSRYEIPDHAPLGRGGITDNTPLVVTASGPWTATITNIPLDGISTDFNPGFSFSSSSIETVLKSGDNSFGDLFQIYTTGDNTSVSETRHGFLMVTLDEDPETYNSIVALTQATKQDVVITPTLPATLRYSAVGAPVGISGATAEQGYTFDINPGKTAGITNTWDVVAAGGKAEYFEIVKTPTPFDPNSPVQRFTIKAKGTTDHTQYPYNSNRHMNMTSQPLTASFAVKYGASSPETVDQYISIVQDPMGISVSTQGTNVPKTGGHIQDVTVNIGEGLHWIAEIKAADNFTSANSNVSLTHHAYLLIDSNDDGIMERQTGAITTHQLRTKKLSVGFDKIYYPMIDESPKATVMVSLAENPSVNTTFTVTQDKLTAAPMNILDVKASSWGNLTGPTHYISAYREYLNNSRLFGPTGKVKTSAIKITGNAPATISGDYSYVHVGGQPEYYSQTTHTAVNDWWNSYGKERLLLYVSDNRLSHLFAGSTSAVALQRKTVLSTLGIKYGQPSSAPKVNSASSATSTQVYDYIINDGPFGAVGSVSTLNFAWDALSTAPDNLPASAVKMLVDGGGERPFLFIDPENNLVYFGECLMFDTTHISAANMAAGNFSGTYANRSKFMANMLAYIVNAAQYGSHFTDLFIFTPSGIEAVKERSGGHTPQELYNDAFHE